MKMKRLLTVFAISAAMAVSTNSLAREVTLTADMSNYGGNGAYLAIYLIDNSGAYQKTLWVAGKKSKYYKHLRGWSRSGAKPSDYDGLTGASVHQGATFRKTVQVDDKYIDSGYQLKIDSSVEDLRDVSPDVLVELTQDGSGQSVSGKRYVRSFIYEIK